MNDSKHLLTMGRPPRTWRDGLPCGNGRLSALLYGNIHQDTILVNDERFYYRSKTLPLPDISEKLQELRSLMLEKKYVAANHLYEDTLRGNGYNPDIAIFQPGLDVLLKTAVRNPFDSYRREIDMANAEARVFWREGQTEFTKRMFVSHVHNFVGFQLAASRTGAITLEIRLDVHDLADAIAQDGRPMDLTLSAEVDLSESFIALKGSTECRGNVVFGGVLRAVPVGGRARVKESTLIIEGADAVEIQVVTYQGEDGDGLIRAAKEKLHGLNAGYDTYFEESRERHRAYYATLDLDLGGNHDGSTNEQILDRAYNGTLDAAAVEKLFYLGRYLLVSSSVPGSLPAHLQGKWNGDYEPPWQCFYMANENIQMNYWQCFAGNLFENAIPLFDYYESLIEDFRTSAKNLFGCRGILVPAATAPDSGLPKILHAQIMYWTGAGGWIARHFYDYYLYTGDEAFLRKRALPFMAEVVQFYEDFLVEDESGKLRFFPSVSPENYPENFYRDWRDGGPVFISINATMEIAICREVLDNLITGSERAQVNAEFIPRWRSLLARLPAYLMANDGTISEWNHPDFPDHENHRHLSHLYPFFPGNEFTADNPARRVAIHRILDRRLTIGLQDQTGWSLAHMANVFSRFRAGDDALRCFLLLMRSCIGPNFFSYHNDDRKMGITLHEIWGRSAPFQVEANMGCTAAVLEMLIASAEGRLTLLPGLPKKWRKGRVSGLRAMGGIEVLVEWNLDAGEMRCELTASREQHVQLEWGVTPAWLQTAQGVNLSAGAQAQGPVSFILPKKRAVKLDFLVRDPNARAAKKSTDAPFSPAKETVAG